MLIDNYSINGWITNQAIKTEDGKQYTFTKHKFMFDILSEMKRLEKDLVIYKAAQIGFSTAAILASFWIAAKRKVDIIYTLPTAADVKDFAGGKINRIVAQNNILQDWVKDKDTVEQKTVGDNIIYYRGTWTQKAAMMVSSDLNIYDEVDTSNQAVVEQYSTRLQASDLQREWFFSHPSVPGNGVARHWEKSDQKHWFIRCEHCKKEQYLSWPDSVCEKRKIYVCKSCDKELSDEVRREGRWVAKYKDRMMSGYWIPLLICPWVKAEKILEYYNNKSEEYFYNKVLGLPYVGSGNKVTLDVLSRNFTNEINTQEGRIVIGCDTGLTQYYVAGNEQGIFYYGKSKGYDEIEKMLRRWDNAIVVFDAGGDLVKPRELREKYIGRIFLCHYAEDRKTMQLVRWGKDKEEGNVVADRNRLIQLIVDEFSDKRIPLQGSENDWWDYWLHWNNVFRTEKENHLGIPTRKWERNGDDHWVHSTVYWRIGMERFGVGEGSIIGEDTGLLGVRTAPTVMPDDTTAPFINTKAIIKRQGNQKDYE